MSDNLVVVIEPPDPEIVVINEGIEGQKGTDANMQVIKHDDDGDLSRPDFAFVIWIGSVEPSNAVDGDIWLDNA